MKEQTRDAAIEQARERVLKNHPIQYAIDDLTDEVIYHTENTPTPEGRRWERFNRCDRCEQWSPCDVRTVAGAASAPSRKEVVERIEKLRSYATQEDDPHGCTPTWNAALDKAIEIIEGRNQ